MSFSDLNNAYTIRIKAVNGVLFLASEDPIDLRHESIACQDTTHVLSICKTGKPKVAVSHGFTFKQVNIEDQHIPDILSLLNDVSKWIESRLPSSSMHSKHTANQVLISCEVDHQTACLNALLVGFLMRYLRTRFSVALGLAQESIPSLTINNNFERQLRIWEFCRYNIYQIDPQSRPMSPHPSVDVNPMPGTYPLSPIVTGSAIEGSIDWTTSTLGTGQHKPAYLAWRKECDTLLAVSRSRELSQMAANLGKQRFEAGNRDEGQPNSTQYFERTSKEAQWARVEEMEETWNKRLLNGAIPA
ncbi:hypothetical protein H2198_003056 [Neophaeococcomyces mojaviensis]|uniref:Uncharacterized protein n=1 Tax=Neophaeococcomyces mojaviensis TaxID=3383035 RepID=A0ACC3ACL9_9EURO|nr:hypothetical protein H2198_003056 [Knufia sp. JES_112]